MTSQPSEPTGGPLIRMPAKTPAALRAAVARLDSEALPRFDSDWASAMDQARDQFSLLPGRHFTEHWWAWVAVTRWPAQARRFRECERIVATSDDRSARRAAAAEIARILQDAQAAAA
ncbi:DUF6247 family protein [Streptomyces marianii]|uniref:Uncharacterized protein n=1 Tax=Streptomyces marianii TaxID=1817406 RepID=A0A5R9E9G7_9ACTN|nr:DUF6247 family protein [Streptomyces marianii]TLQ45509.1 hypothetical protein FEF34_23090 [Streptomyces marianii]